MKHNGYQIVSESANDSLIGTLPPGIYFFGDPCYVMQESCYREWGSKYDYNDGKFKIKNGFLVAGSTDIGDGLYIGIHQSYGCDSGCLAIVSQSLWKPDINKKDGLIIDSKNPIKYIFKKGTFLITSKNFKEYVDTVYHR